MSNRTPEERRCSECVLGFVTTDDRTWPCPRCGGTGLEEIAEVRAEFVAGYIADIWLEDETE